MKNEHRKTLITYPDGSKVDVVFSPDGAWGWKILELAFVDQGGKEARQTFVEFRPAGRPGEREARPGRGQGGV